MAPATGEDSRKYVVLAFHTFGICQSFMEWVCDERQAKRTGTRCSTSNLLRWNSIIALRDIWTAVDGSTCPTRHPHTVLTSQGLLYALNKRSSPREGTDDVNARVR